MRKSPTVCSLVLALAVPAFAQGTTRLVKPTETDQSYTSAWGNFDGNDRLDFFMTDGIKGDVELHLGGKGWYDLPQLKQGEFTAPKKESWGRFDHPAMRVQFSYQGDGVYHVFALAQDGTVHAYTTKGMRHI